MIKNKDKKSWFFEKKFLLANFNIDIALKMFFFTLKNVVVNFVNQNLCWKLYIITKIFLTIKQVALIGKKEFVVVASDLKNEDFVVYVAFISQNSNFHLFHRA